jgi:hypothetical protein
MNTLLDQHLTELESHNRELLAMNAKLQKENGKMRALLELIDKKSSSMDLCPVCSGDSDDCEPSCEGRRLAKILEY